MGLFSSIYEGHTPRIRKADDCREWLTYHNICGFGFFEEKDGSYRIARGTLQPDIIDSVYTFEGNYTYDENKQVRFWDLDKNEWRSFLFVNLIRTSFKVLSPNETGWNEITNKCIQEVPDFIEKLYPEDKKFIGFKWKRKKQ